MESMFCLSKSKLKEIKDIRWGEIFNETIEEFLNIFTLSEMEKQLMEEKGVFYEVLTKKTNAFVRETENIEIFMSFELADFYFPKEDPDICFKMHSSFNKDNLSYENLISGIESYSPIDCTVKNREKEFDFQIKRYPEEHYPYTKEAMVSYLQKVFNKYGKMNNIRLILLLQPNNEQPKDKLDFPCIHAELVKMKDQITFEEIVFLFNRDMQTIRWQQVFPGSGGTDKSLILVSEKYQKIQQQWKTKK